MGKEMFMSDNSFLQYYIVSIKVNEIENYFFFRWRIRYIFSIFQSQNILGCIAWLLELQALRRISQGGELTWF